MDEKQFANWRAKFALLGQTLTCTISANGQETYFAGRWGLSKPLHSLAEVEAFYTQIGGRA